MDVNMCQYISIRIDLDFLLGYFSTIGGYASFSWLPNTGLSGFNTFNPIVSPATTATYNLAATTSDNCNTNNNIRVTFF